MPKDRKKKPFSCFSKKAFLGRDDVQLENDQVHGWCGTCDLQAKENGESIMNIMNISTIIRKLLKLRAGSALSTNPNFLLTPSCQGPFIIKTIIQ